MNPLEFILYIAVGGFIYLWGYRKGKIMMILLIRAHQLSGSDAETAIQYESDILEGKVPRG